ncbi:hypothetical protein EVAR_75843_1 [Eumeta japonica]|uniref:Uncharacterized protein n=1 Tax=Eumeta variegata TaxID=151549 RepID=A0A4C1TD94_EUMVA|nr:hypothetical protein EVAR_75843_1 [Eumeta japonica]
MKVVTYVNAAAGAGIGRRGRRATRLARLQTGLRRGRGCHALCILPQSFILDRGQWIVRPFRVVPLRGGPLTAAESRKRDHTRHRYLDVLFKIQSGIINLKLLRNNRDCYLTHNSIFKRSGGSLMCATAPIRRLDPPLSRQKKSRNIRCSKI